MAAHTKTRPAPAKANRKAAAPVPSKSTPAKKAAAKPSPSPARKAPAGKVAVKVVKPVAKKAPLPKPVVKSAAKPTLKKATPAKPAAKAPAKSAVKSVSKPAAKTVSKVAPKPAVKASVKPTAKTPVKSASKPAVKAVSKPVAKPLAKPVSKPAAKPVVKPAVKVPVKAVAKAAVKPAASKTAAPAKPAAKSAPAKAQVSTPPAPVKQTSKPVEMSRPNPVMTQAALEAERRKLAKMKESQKKPQPVVAPKIKATTARKYHPEFLKSVLDKPAHSEQTGPMIRYSDADLQEFRELITKKLEDSKRELAYWQGIITHKGEMSGDESESRYGGMEEGVSSEREYASHMASRTLDFIEKLEKALMRIQNKTYGICRVTGKLIDKARLRAVPHATLSMDAKMAMSKNPGGSNNH